MPISYQAAMEKDLCKSAITNNRINNYIDIFH